MYLIYPFSTHYSPKNIQKGNFYEFQPTSVRSTFTIEDRAIICFAPGWQGDDRHYVMNEGYFRNLVVQKRTSPNWNCNKILTNCTDIRKWIDSFKAAFRLFWFYSDVKMYIVMVIISGQFILTEFQIKLCKIRMSGLWIFFWLNQEMALVSSWFDTYVMLFVWYLQLNVHKTRAFFII